MSDNVTTNEELNEEVTPDDSGESQGGEETATLTKINAKDLQKLTKAESGQSILLVDTEDNTGLIIDYERLRNQIVAELLSSNMTSSSLKLMVCDRM